MQRQCKLWYTYVCMMGVIGILPTVVHGKPGDKFFFYLYSPWLGCNSYYESVNKQKRGRAKIRSEITFKINMNERTKQMYRAR